MSLCGDAELKYLMMSSFIPVFAEKRKETCEKPKHTVMAPLNTQFGEQQLWGSILFYCKSKTCSANHN